MPAQQIDLKKAIELHDVMDFFTIAESKDPFIVFFYAAHNGPSNMIKPIYCSYSEEYAAAGIKFYLVDALKQPDLAQQFNVIAYPTFITYQNGQLKEKWAGANQITLKQKVEGLKGVA